MYIKGLFKNPAFTGPLVIVGIFTALFVVANIFVIGGDAFYNTANSLVAAAAALVTSFLFFQAAANKRDSASHSLWWLMAWGFGLWGLADSIYAFYFVVLNEELPTPSIADLFWILAYMPLYLALIARLRTIKVKPSRRQVWFIIGFSVALALVTAVFVLLPITRELDSSRVLEGLVSLFYPLADVGLFLLASLFLILLKVGRFSVIWRLIFSGIFFMTLSDLVYSYASWNGLYMPDGLANAVTILTDTTYTLAYILCGVGIYIYRFIWNVTDSFTFHIERLPAEQYYAFAGTGRDNQVICASNNFYVVVGGDAEAVYQHKPLDEVLGIRASDWQALFHQLLTKEMICQEPVIITPPGQKSQNVWITSIATFNPGREFIGANFVLAADIPVPSGLRLPNSKELLAMVNHLLARAGSRPQDEIQAIEVYCLELIRLLSALLYQFGGEQLRGALFDHLEQITSQQNLPLKIDSRSIQFMDFQDGPSLARHIWPLLQSARKFVVDVIGAEIVNDEIKELENQFTVTVKRDLDKYNLRAVVAAA